ncbi:MAG: hypothetical protein LBG81_09105, partial [Coriobacteriaceae bacterium]|nr:hypothetical protein [Coriobacteriaceae bacterium]
MMAGQREYEDYLRALKGRFVAEDEYAQAMAEAEKSGQAAYSDAVRKHRQHKEEWEGIERRVDKLEKRLASLSSRVGIAPETAGIAPGAAGSAPQAAVVAPQAAGLLGNASPEGAPFAGIASPEALATAQGALGQGVAHAGNHMPFPLRTSTDVDRTLDALADAIEKAEEKLAWALRNDPDGFMTARTGVAADARATQAAPAAQAASAAASQTPLTKKGGCRGTAMLLGTIGLLMCVLGICALSVL